MTIQEILAAKRQPATAPLAAASTLSLAERLAAKKALQDKNDLVEDPTDYLDSSYNDSPLASATSGDEVAYDGAFSLSIVLNERQLLAKELALKGTSFCLIGPAGSGKTTTQRSVAASLLESKSLKTTSFKVRGSGGKERSVSPSIAFCAYTRRASANLERAIHKDPALAGALEHNVMTIHHLLEFEPVIYWDPETQKDSMRFEPQRHRRAPLEITHLVIEEASMLGLDLAEQLYDALPLGVQVIFIGDINQLPPVFGASVLNYALVQLPVVELTEVHRQAQDSPVLSNAHRILKGLPLIEAATFTIIRGKSPVQHGQEKVSYSLGELFKNWHTSGYYNPEDSVILSPWNKQALGTDNLNRWIAQFLGTYREATVYEVLAGFAKHYLAVGDKVMYNKQDGVITAISYNGLYHGPATQQPGQDLSRFGVRIASESLDSPSTDLDDLLLGYSTFSIDELEKQKGERKIQASHVVTLELESGEIISLSAAGDFAPQTFSLGYVLTVHKAQGCEWRKVFIVLHKDHAISLSRELLYTAVTRAREECVIIAKDQVIERAIATQRIKGDTLADKIEYFNSGALGGREFDCTP